MALKTIVKVGRITNLSDARYCAGMGVDMLGFRVIEGQGDFVDPKMFQEMRGWITGPKIVVELYGLESPSQLEKIIEHYRPDYLELSLKELALLPLPLAHSFLLFLAPGEVSTHSPEYQIASEPGSFQKPTLIQVTHPDQVLPALQCDGVRGISLSGSQELRPGLKEYHLASILEALEVED